MEDKILFAVTSCGQLGNIEKATGYYFSEVTHPWKVLYSAGYEIDVVSPFGGKAPIDAFNLDDPINKEFWENEEYHDKVMHTLLPNQVVVDDYAAIFFAGGHGAMWDFPHSTELAELAVRIYEKGGIIGAVCHGPAIFMNMKLSNGNYLVDGLRINGFTNEEETQMEMETIVPFLLESGLMERGGKFEKSAPFQPHAVIDKRVVTGQNPASATCVGENMLKLLDQLELPEELD